jgi:hypothetical protein
MEVNNKASTAITSPNRSPKKRSRSSASAPAAAASDDNDNDLEDKAYDENDNVEDDLYPIDMDSINEEEKKQLQPILDLVNSQFPDNSNSARSKTIRTQLHSKLLMLGYTSEHLKKAKSYQEQRSLLIKRMFQTLVQKLI